MTGPFPHRRFLEAVENTGRVSPVETHITATSDGAIALVIDDTTVSYAGDAELTDYHAPLGDSPVDMLVGAFEEL